MATPIDRIGQHELSPTLRALAKEGGTTDHADWIRSGKNAAILIKFIDHRRYQAIKNPHEMSVENQIAALRRANDEECAASNGHWHNLAEDDFQRLAATAPAWPKGGYAFRGFRIRFGHATEGVERTFNAHCLRIKRVLREVNCRWQDLKAMGCPIEMPHLIKGNETHKPCVEWVVADLGMHRIRDSIEAVRGSNSLADELLAMAWLFPRMITSIDYDQYPGLYAAGYEAVSSEGKGCVRRSVVKIGYDRHPRAMTINEANLGNNFTDCSVPELLPPSSSD